MKGKEAVYNWVLMAMVLSLWLLVLGGLFLWLLLWAAYNYGPIIMVLLLVSAWLGLYKLWYKELRGKSLISNWWRALMLVTWLVLFMITAFCTVIVLGLLVYVVSHPSTG